MDDDPFHPEPSGCLGFVVRLAGVVAAGSVVGAALGWLWAARATR